ncbi:MAG: ATP-dependent Clp protease ATP-binding subunit [Actinobacteria bacterium]|nr:ATP-dependent Clp protease ATP-binding subunit [Actinomycetota bacterium]
MLEDLGESAKLAITYAMHACWKLRQRGLGPGHLFLGIVELGDLNLRRHFAMAGADMGEAAERVRGGLRRGSGGSLQVYLTERAQRILANAAGEAARLNHEKVEAPHVLVALLEEGRGPLARAVKAQGSDPEQIANLLRTMLRHGAWTPDFYRRRKAVEQPGTEKTSQLMENLGRDLTEQARRGELDPIIGREKETLQLIQILLSRKKSNPVLVGDAGVGKTAIVENLAQLIVEGKVPPELRGKRVRTVEVGALVAGTVYRGSFEEKVLAFVNEARDDPDLIVFIDEMHSLIGAGRASMDALDASNILKPALSRGDFKCIGATTYGEYRAYVESDPALARRFQPVYVGETTPEDTLGILRGLRGKYEAFHGLKIMDDALGAAVEYSMRYLPERRLPDKALDLLDQACSHRRLQSFYGLGEPGRLSGKEKESALSRHPVPPAVPINLITRDDVARVISNWTGIPVGKITADESEKLLKMESLIRRRLVGQDQAVSAVCHSIRSARAGLRDPRRPVGVFLFLGPTGVGKTELAKALAEVLFDDEEKVIRVDMSECYDRSSISRLIGSSRGYTDSDRGGMLTEAVKKNPYSVVLLDEVEKADRRVLDLLLQVMEEGRLSDGLGRLVDFRNAVIIMTSNVGADRLRDRPRVGFEAGRRGARDRGARGLRDELEGELRLFFRPEFLNRIDEVVVFNPLAREELREIARLMLSRIPIKVEASPRVLDFLVAAGNDPALGARPLKRAIDDLVVEPLAYRLIAGKLCEQDAIRLGLSRGRITFRRKRAEERKGPGVPEAPAGKGGEYRSHA